MNKSRLEAIIKEDLESIQSIKERRIYLKEMADYLLNICPRHYKYKCEDCKNDCKNHYNEQ